MIFKKRENLYGILVTLFSFSIIAGLAFNSPITGYATAKPDICEIWFGDSICDDSPADCGAYHSKQSEAACDECQTTKEGKVGFANCGATSIPPKNEPANQQQCETAGGKCEPYLSGNCEAGYHKEGYCGDLVVPCCKANNYCNEKSPDGCWCDTTSVTPTFNDFCDDIESTCGIKKPSAATKPGLCKVTAKQLPTPQPTGQQQCETAGGKCEPYLSGNCEAGYQKDGYCSEIVNVPCCKPIKPKPANQQQCETAGGKCEPYLSGNCKAGFQKDGYCGDLVVPCCKPDQAKKDPANQQQCETAGGKCEPYLKGNCGAGYHKEGYCGDLVVPCCKLDTYCGGKGSLDCYCDPASVKPNYNDFCDDIESTCGIEKPKGVAATKPGTCKKFII